jgi:uncharacterized protein
MSTSNDVHRTSVVAWWDSDQSETIAFARITQIGVLRLLTTASAMDGKPLGLREAWHAYDRLFTDAPVSWLPNPLAWSRAFARVPKLWADAYLVAVAYKPMPLS